LKNFPKDKDKAKWKACMHMFAAFFAPYIGGLLYRVSPYNPFLVAIAITPILSILALTRPWKEGD